ncbi:hypothetical protein [Vibrio harveyi]
MKKCFLFLACSAFAFSSFAYNNGNGGTTNLGPIIECVLPSGDVAHLPSEMCRFQGGSWDN